MYISLAFDLLPTKAIFFPSGLHFAVKILDKSNVSFSLLPLLTSIKNKASEPPAFDANTIFLPSGDQDIPGCNNFNSSKSGVLLPLTIFLFLQ